MFHVPQPAQTLRTYQHCLNIQTLRIHVTGMVFSVPMCLRWLQTAQVHVTHNRFELVVVSDCLSAANTCSDYFYGVPDGFSSERFCVLLCFFAMSASKMFVLAYRFRPPGMY